jgi:hypothetical protein
MIVSSEEAKKSIIAEGGPVASTPEEYAANIEREEGKRAALINKLGLKWSSVACDQQTLTLARPYHCQQL